MKLKKLALVAEIAAGAGVLVSLVVLIFGVRENTEMVRMSAYSDLVSDVNLLIGDMYRDAELNRIWYGIYQGNTESFSEIDVDRATVIINSQFRNYEKAYFGNEYGVMDAGEWDRFERAICSLYTVASDFRATHTLGIVAELPSRLTVTDEFRGYVEESCNG